MSSISSTISLQDKISQTLNKIANRAETVTRAMQQINEDTEKLSNAGIKELINPSAVNTVYAAQNGIRQFDSSFQKLKATVNAFTHPIQTLNSFKATFNQLKTTAGSLKTAFQNVVNTKWNSLKTGVSSVKNVLTQGETGAKGFFNALKNIGKISVSAVANGINKLKSGLVTLSGSAVKNAVKGLKELGSITLKTVINGAKKLCDSLSKAVTLAAKGAVSLGKWTLKTAAAGITAATTAVTGLAAAAVKTGSEFDTAMSQVAATMLIDKNTEEGAAKFKVLEDAARECGRTTAFSATEAGQALNYLALAGYDETKAAAALPTVLNLAGAGAMDLATASDMVTDSMSALGIAATKDNLTSFADKLAKTASKANTSVQQLGEAIITVGGTASQLAGGTTELNASLGILADSGIKGAEGGTHLRNMILSLQNARSDAAAALFKDMKFSAYDDNGDMRGMGDIFGDLNKQFEGATAQEINEKLATIFKVTDISSARVMLAATADSVTSLGSVMDSALSESGTSLSKLGINLEQMAESFDKTMTQEAFAAQMNKEFGLSAEQAGIMYTGLESIVDGTGNRFDELTKAIDDSNGACEEMYNIQLDNLTGDIAILKSAVSDLGIAFSKDLDKPLRGITQYATELVGMLSQSYENGGLEEMLSSLGNIAAEVIGKGLEKLPEIVNLGTKLLTSLLDGIIANTGIVETAMPQVISAFGGGLAKIIPKIIILGKNIILGLIAGISENPEKAINGVLEVGGVLLSAIGEIIPPLLNAAAQIGILLLPVIDNIISGLVNTVIQIAPMLIPIVLTGLLSIVNFIAVNIPKFIRAGLELIKGLVQGVLNAIPLLLEQAPVIIQNIINGITEVLPDIIQTGIDIMIALLNGMIEYLPQFTAKIPEIFMMIVKGILSVDWLTVGKNILKTIAEGIVSGVKTFGSSIGKSIKGLFGIKTDEAAVEGGSVGSAYATSAAKSAQSFVPKITNTFSSIDLTNCGINTVASFGTGMTVKTADTVKSAEGIGNDVVNVFAKIDLEPTGVNIMKGLNNGMLKMKSTLLSTASNIATEISEKINKALDIHSPSKKTAWTGEMIGLGLIKGLNNTLNAVGEKSYELADSTTAGLDNEQKKYLLSGGKSKSTSDSSGTSIIIDMSNMKNIVNEEKDWEKLIEMLESRLENALISTAEGAY